MWLQAGKADLTAKYEQIEISIPSSYITFAVAMAFSNSLIKLINYFVLNEFTRIAGNILLRFDNAVAITVIMDGEHAWTLPLLPQYRFFRSETAHRFLASIAGVVLMSPAIILGVYIFVSYLSSAYVVLMSKGVMSFPSVLCIAGTIMVIFPIIYTSLLSIPIPFRKNPMFIRWLFLYRLYKKEGSVPGHVQLWLR
jgi:hypothetical protein